MAAAQSRSRMIPLLLLALPYVLALAVLPGCGSDNPSCVCGTSRIVGAIRTVGPHPRAEVTAHGANSGSYIAAEADSTGNYVLLVPPDDYDMTLQLADNYFILTADGFSNYEDRSPRKISVGKNQEVRIDADFGSAAVTLATPPEMEGMPIDVRLMGPDWSGYAYDTVSAGQASFTFPVAVPGNYTLGVHIKSSRYFYLPGSYRPLEARLFRVDAGSNATIEGSLPTLGWISGTITGAWQEMDPSLSRPHIALAAEPDSIVVAGSSVADDGTFSLPIFTPIRGRISVQIWSNRWYGGRTFASAMSVEGSPGETTRLELHDSGIALRFEGDWYDLHLYDASRHPLLAQAFPLSAGAIGFLNLEPSTYYLKVDGKEGSWLDQWFDQAGSANATSIEVEQGQLRTIDFHLQTGGRIEGRVFAGDGSPVFVAGITLFRSSHEVTYQATAEDGSYSLTGFGDGDYKVLATYFRQSLWYPGVADSLDATAISIRGMNTISGVDVHFPE